MKASLLGLSSAVLGLALVDFLANTLPALGETRDLDRTLEEDLEQAIARVEERGAPPDRRALEALTQGTAQVEKALEQDRSAVFARARQGTDYLFPASQRPAEGGLARAHETLVQALLPLQLEIHAYPAFNTHDLGIRFPSATAAVELDGAKVRDQAERVVLVQWLLDCLRAGEGLELGRCLLTRAAPGAPLEVDLMVSAGIEDLVPFGEGFLAPTDQAPPRLLDHLEFARLAPADWAPDLARYRSPPVELRLKVHLMAPEGHAGTPDPEVPETAAEGPR